ncbi:MAG TPA: CHASE2 domain-containing protein, partial [Chroococcidiopsis sp.]
MKRNTQPGRDRSNPKESSSAMGPSKPRWKWNWTRLGYTLTGVWALTGAIATAIDLGTAQAMERQAQIGFFRLRGRVVPSNIVILAMDQESLARGDDYLLDPAANPQFEPIQSYPWRRSAYAIAIDKLMAAGARSVSIDVVFDGPRQDDPAGDEALRQALQRYGDHVVLAAQYEPFGTPESGEMGQMVFPSDLFGVRRDRLGLINFAVDADQKVYQLPEFFIRQVLVPQGLGEGVSS